MLDFFGGGGWKDKKYFSMLQIRVLMIEEFLFCHLSESGSKGQAW